MPGSVFDLYPHQQGNSDNLLENSNALFGAIGKVTEAQKAQLELQGRRAIGQIYSQHINPDGTIDTQGFLHDVANTPAAASVPELATSVIDQQGHIIQNSANLLSLYGGQNRAVADFFGLLDLNSTSEAINNAFTNFSRVMPSISATTLYGWNDLIQDDPQGIAHGIATARAVATGPAALAGRVEGLPSVEGAPQKTSLGTTIYGAPTFPTAMAPGFAERQTGAANLDDSLAGYLAEAAEGSPGRIGILGNLQSALQNFTTGPGADWTKVAKAFVNRNVPLPAGWQFNPQSIASQEEFIKQAGQLAQQQFGAIGGTGTDAKFTSAFQTNPNDTLSHLGNRGIIRLLQGNEDALQAKNTAWLAAAQRNPALSYRQFSQAFNTHFDPRVFQLKYVPQAQRDAYLAGLDPIDRNRFLQNLAFAMKQGWVNFGTRQ